MASRFAIVLIHVVLSWQIIATAAQKVISRVIDAIEIDEAGHTNLLAQHGHQPVKEGEDKDEPKEKLMRRSIRTMEIGDAGRTTLVVPNGAEPLNEGRAKDEQRAKLMRRRSRPEGRREAIRRSLVASHGAHHASRTEAEEQYQLSAANDKRYGSPTAIGNEVIHYDAGEAGRLSLVAQLGDQPVREDGGKDEPKAKLMRRSIRAMEIGDAGRTALVMSNGAESLGESRDTDERRAKLMRRRSHTQENGDVNQPSPVASHGAHHASRTEALEQYQPAAENEKMYESPVTIGNEVIQHNASKMDFIPESGSGFVQAHGDQGRATLDESIWWKNPPPPPPCLDRYNDCAARKAAGQCQSHSSSLAYHCCLTCTKSQCRSLGSSTRSRQHAINIVFLPSGFRGNMALFRQKVQQIYTRFQQHAAYRSNIAALNYYIAEAEVIPNDDGRYCTTGCNNIKRLLCCRLADFDRVATSACGSGAVVNKVIVHNNDNWYGGAGAANGATLSTHPSSFQIAVHEVGHSLWNLADEYTSDDAGPPNPMTKGNCDTTGCPKWSDLIGKFGVGCHYGLCRNGRYYASEKGTLMRLFSSNHLGAVSERIACCKYLTVISTEPSFCRKFTGGGLNLRSFCAKNYWKGSLSLISGSAVHGNRRFGDADNEHETEEITNETEYMIRRASDTQGMIYRFLQKPRAFSVEKDPKTGRWTCSEENDVLVAGLYPQNEVEGDEKADAHMMNEKNELVRRDDDLTVVAVHADGTTTRIPYHKYDKLEAPGDLDNVSSEGETALVPRTIFRAVFDNTSPVRACSVEGS